MKVKIDSDFLQICLQILKEEKTSEEWAMVESDDYFQCEKYEGGFDSIENAFCFSYYDSNGSEYWFQLTLNEIKDVFEGKKNFINVRMSE